MGQTPDGPVDRPNPPPTLVLTVRRCGVDTRVEEGVLGPLMCLTEDVGKRVIFLLLLFGLEHMRKKERSGCCKSFNKRGV